MFIVSKCICNLELKEKQNIRHNHKARKPRMMKFTLSSTYETENAFIQIRMLDTHYVLSTGHIPANKAETEAGYCPVGYMFRNYDKCNQGVYNRNNLI